MIEEYLQLFIQDLCYLQHGLDTEPCTNKFIHNKLINICQNIFACQYTYFKPIDSRANFINDLRFFIITFQKLNVDNMQMQALFTNWHYFKQYQISLSAYT